MSDRQRAAKWAHDILKSDFCVLDTETTGLKSNDEICSIAVIDRNGSTLIDSLILPNAPISEASTAIHGITGLDVLDAPTFEAIFIPLLRAIHTRDLVIYNADFDLKMLRQTARAYGFPLAFPTSDRRQTRIWIGGGSIHCAMLWYSQWVGEWNDYHDSYKWQKLPGGDHTALGDCKATLDVIKRMADSYKPGEPVQMGGDDPPKNANDPDDFFIGGRG